MDISGIISALVVGVVIGALGRLVLPGRQRVGLLWTVVVGIAAAFVGTGIASGLGVADTRGFDWIELIIQVALAAVGVGALERARAGGRVRR
ncbi:MULTISPECIES: GlsB/YeaQ/YmgE family stress response membrane protein [unclassified Streptomyces]|uniref:GlsB/YeaQ/YmgE family stress response membrane protein n=1 Tax=unclassified Streptomyces TaxID=2593676 RepID=UPI0023EC51EF|nr:GlsB/YeaQ/YmgE family stress response membrane protein [Streptomyces sp. WMMB303]MDF4249309.1 GlsB/YeaQ/YmgE family stress response membrane protein [Streptomyces sp. WMMB303]